MKRNRVLGDGHPVTNNCLISTVIAREMFRRVPNSCGFPNKHFVCVFITLQRRGALNLPSRHCLTLCLQLKPQEQNWICLASP